MDRTNENHLPQQAGQRAREGRRQHAGGFLRHLFHGLMLALTLSLPSGLQADERLEAAMAIVVPPAPSDVDRMVGNLARTRRDSPRETQALRARLVRMYGSDEFRLRTARVYAKYLSEEELRYLAETLQHPVFRRYRALAPEIMLELAAIEREMFSSPGP